MTYCRNEYHIRTSHHRLCWKFQHNCKLHSLQWPTALSSDYDRLSLTWCGQTHSNIIQFLLQFSLSHTHSPLPIDTQNAQPAQLLLNCCSNIHLYIYANGRNGLGVIGRRVSNDDDDGSSQPILSLQQCNKFINSHAIYVYYYYLSLLLSVIFVRRYYYFCHTAKWMKWMMLNGSTIEHDKCNVMYCCISIVISLRRAAWSTTNWRPFVPPVWQASWFVRLFFFFSSSSSSTPGSISIWKVLCKMSIIKSYKSHYLIWRLMLKNNYT